jgi:hypothetical protein
VSRVCSPPVAGWSLKKKRPQHCRGQSHCGILQVQLRNSVFVPARRFWRPRGPLRAAQAVDRATSENEHRGSNFEANEVRIPGGDQGFGGRAAQEKNTILSQFTL